MTMRAAITIHHVNAMYRSDFVSFTGKCFNWLTPGSSFLMNWHIEAMAHHLDLVRLGKLKRLIINLPPRSLKSIMCSVAFPAFLLGHDPTKRLVAISYNAALAEKHSNDFRVIVTAPWYQHIFPRMRISPIKNTESEVATTLRGYRLATSIDGTLTGRGGDIVIIDDPQKPMNSDIRRERTNDWFNNTLVSRLDNKETGAIVIVMQRLHIDDLTGRQLRAGGWTLLSLPAIAEQDEAIRLGADRYHIRRVGDVLHPERGSRFTLDGIRCQMGSDDFAAQYQQAPVPPGGVMIKRDWVGRYDQLPARTSASYLIQSWDTASKAGEQNDWCVCTTWLYHENKYYLMNVLRGRLDYPTLKAIAISHADVHQPDIILIEDTGVGTALVAELKNARLSAVGIRPEHDKRTRMSIQSVKFESGQVLFPKQAPWLADLETELFAFPNSIHDDQVDSIAQALAHKLSTSGWNDRSLAGLANFVSGLGWINPANAERYGY